MSSSAPASAASTWAGHPDAEAVVVDHLDRARKASAVLGRLAGELEAVTATKLIDWVDSIGLPIDATALAELGWREDAGTGLWRHPAARLPAVSITPAPHVSLKTDDIEAFAHVHGAPAAPTGAPDGVLRMLEVGIDGGIGLRGLQRRSYASGIEPEDRPQKDATDATDATDVAAARARWAARPLVGDDTASMAQALDAARFMVNAVGHDRAAAFVLEHERERWQSRCAAAKGTSAAQQRFGLGFANRDHHTLRSSRASFAGLIACLHTLGFESREQFHAGAEAEWGALVLEHPGTGDVVFADVDLDPTEADADLAAGLAPRPLGPVGVWCALHGDSFLGAGLHHLAALYDFDHYRLAASAPPLQDPFSDFDHLRQAFTQPESWDIEPARLERLLAGGELPSAAIDRCRSGRAPGSHLEIIERRHGFKGFNQHSVSRTIAHNDLRS